MEPLMITASCGFVRPPGPDKRPDTVEEVIESVVECYKAGACIAQVRAPITFDPVTNRGTTSVRAWVDITEGIRKRCDILVMFGVAGGPVEERAEILAAAKPDISSFLISHHDIVARGHDIFQLLLRPDAVRMLRMHLDANVLPQFEIFHAGALWNLDYLLREVDVPRPLAVTLFFWDGGTWAPPTVEEFLRRMETLPPDSSCVLATAHGHEQTLLHTIMISRGGHVRAGLGDHFPYYTQGVLAQSNAQLVSRLARIARDLDRPLATPQEAARLLGLRRAG